MDYYSYIVLITLVVFGAVSIKQDVYKRKVSNYITFPFLILSFLFFLFMINTLVWIDFIFIFLLFGLAYFLYHKGLWGAADGKIFVALILFLLSLGHSEMSLRFIINMFLFYAFTMFFVVLIRTKRKDKIRLLKKFDFVDTILLILLIFVFIRGLLFFFDITQLDVFLLLIVFVALILAIDHLRKFISPYLIDLHDDIKYMFIAILFVLLFFYGGGFGFIIIFALIVLIKTSISIMSSLSSKVKIGRKKYESPFTIYLFFGAVFTVVTNSSFIEILIRLI